MSDAINPKHYNQGSIECIDAMEQVLTAEEYRGFLKGNLIKYLWREKNKSGIEDLLEAKRYLDRLVDSFNTDHDSSTPEATGEVTGEVKPPDGWRFLNRGEVIRKCDQGFENGFWYSIEPTMVGMTLQLHWRPILRRNKFEVGEKVVEVVNNRIGVVKGDEATGKSLLYYVEMQNTKRRIFFSPHHLAPYIEESK